MERYLKIAKVNWKFNLFPHVIVAFMICLISPLIMGVENLDYLQTAKILDVYISLLGLILLVPLFIPDEDENILDLVKSKKESMAVIHIIRLLESILFLTIFILGFLFYLKTKSCNFPFTEYFYGTMANCIFIGGLGILIYSIFNNLAVAYMVPMLYYIMCYGAGKKYLGKLYLFSMMRGNIEDKKYLLISGIAMITVGIMLRNIKIQLLNKSLKN